tara:strand:- start:199 stop:777 length:579 start_codon:yes stop_codon:yes gene_type:complete
MHKPAIIIALKEEAVGVEHHNIYISGVGKVNAAIATMKAIHDGANHIINYGTAGLVNDLPGIVEPNYIDRGLVVVSGFVDRDMDATPMGFKLGQTPYEEEILLGTEGLVCGTGDTFATKKPDIKCDIVDMEGYAIAKICYHLPMLFSCWKYISDNVDENSPDDFMKNVSKGNKEFNNKLKETIEFYENQYKR